MILGSHNSWSYLPVRKWWMKPIAFTARCQSVDIRKQYELGVRCFDLRVRFTSDYEFRVAHGIVEYKISRYDILNTLWWLNDKGDCYVRVIFEARTVWQYCGGKVKYFQGFCSFIQYKFKNIRFWCGRDMYIWDLDFVFGHDPSCDEKYGSVSKHKWLYAWWPWLYARLHNRKILKEGTDCDILLIDYVNI